MWSFQSLSSCSMCLIWRVLLTGFKKQFRGSSKYFWKKSETIRELFGRKSDKNRVKLGICPEKPRKGSGTKNGRYLDEIRKESGNIPEKKRKKDGKTSGKIRNAIFSRKFSEIFPRFFRVSSEIIPTCFRNHSEILPKTRRERHELTPKKLF